MFRGLRLLSVIAACALGNAASAQQLANPDMIARGKLDAARAAMMAGFYNDAGRLIIETLTTPGISDETRIRALVMTCNLTFRVQDWSTAKLSCEKVIQDPLASLDDKLSAKDTLEIVRRFKPELFSN